MYWPASPGSPAGGGTMVGGSAAGDNCPPLAGSGSVGDDAGVAVVGDAGRGPCFTGFGTGGADIIIGDGGGGGGTAMQLANPAPARAIAAIFRHFRITGIATLPGVDLPYSVHALKSGG
jgi:hypothetical protein